MTQNAEKQRFFSIITVSLNNLAGLKRTGESVRAQTGQDFEWIVIDGCSSDGSAEHLKSTTANWSSTPDDGIYDAMNKGIKRANGRYLLFLNAGDTLANAHTLQKIKTAAAKNMPAFIYGDALEGSAHKPARAPDITCGMFTHHQAMLYNRKALKEIRYDTFYKIAADYDFTARFLTAHNNILYCPFPLCDFEPGGISQQQAALGRREQYQIRKNLKLASPSRNIIITGAQMLLWQLRRYVPSLYWHLKSSGNSTRAIAQNDTPPAHPKTPA